MLDIKDLTIEFLDTQPPTVAVDKFNLHMEPGQVTGIVGESGSGKTMTALALMGLLGKHADIPSGKIIFDGQDISDLNGETVKKIRGKDISMIFQEPMTSLNPVLQVGEQVEEALLIHTDLTKVQRKEAAIDMLRAVELPDPQSVYEKFPHQLSGGMRQRVMIAASLICHPKLLIADEPTTALDVTIQAQMIRLLKKINQESHTAILFISHNLGVVKQLCQNVLVMKDGKIVEQGKMEEIFSHPKAEYTKNLLAAIPNRRTSLRRNSNEK